MKKYVIPVLGILSVSLIVAFWFYEKGAEVNKPNIATDSAEVSEERREECNQFMMVATFPNDGSAEAFMESCLAGEPVLPGELD